AAEHTIGPGTELVAFTGSVGPPRGPDQDQRWGLTRRAACETEVVTPLPLAPGDPDLDVWVEHRLDLWRVAQDLTVPADAPKTPPKTPPATDRPDPQVRLPAAPGHPSAIILALEPTTPVATDHPCP